MVLWHPFRAYLHVHTSEFFTYRIFLLADRSRRLHVASVPESPQADAELKDVQALAGSCFICACDLKKGINVTEAYQSNRRCKLGAIAIR